MSVRILLIIGGLRSSSWLRDQFVHLREFRAHLVRIYRVLLAHLYEELAFSAGILVVDGVQILQFGRIFELVNFPHERPVLIGRHARASLLFEFALHAWHKRLLYPSLNDLATHRTLLPVLAPDLHPTA